MFKTANPVKLSRYASERLQVQPKEPEHLLNWKEVKPELKRFILIHLIRAIDENKTCKLTISKLIEILSCNMGQIQKDQVKIFVENLQYYGFINNENNRGITFTNKVYEDLQTIDEILSQKNIVTMEDQ